VFTTYPGGFEDYMATDWTGGWLPKAEQYKNVIVLIYSRPDMGLLDALFPSYTHAYFPKDAFDEWLQAGNWTFGRKGDAYVGLYSLNPVRWAEGEPESAYELIADGRSNVWICELGSRGEWGGFDEFVEALSVAQVSVDGLSVVYESPSAGTVRMSWDGPMTVDGVVVNPEPYARFDNEFIRHEFGSKVYEFRRGTSRLELDFETPRRRYWR